MDWRKLEPRMGREPLPPDWLEKRRSELEMIVEAFVTTRKTDTIIEFKGKRRYLIEDPRRIEWIKRPALEAMARPTCAVMALQFLYRMEAARAEGDIDTAVRMAIVFARADSEVQNLWWFGADTMQAMAGRERRRSGSAKGGKNKAKWKPECEAQARPVFDGIRRQVKSDDAACRQTLAKLGWEMSVSTLKRGLGLKK